MNRPPTHRHARGIPLAPRLWPILLVAVGLLALEPALGALGRGSPTASLQLALVVPGALVTVWHLCWLTLAGLTRWSVLPARLSATLRSQVLSHGTPLARRMLAAGAGGLAAGALILPAAHADEGETLWPRLGSTAEESHLWPTGPALVATAPVPSGPASSESIDPASNGPVPVDSVPVDSAPAGPVTVDSAPSIPDSATSTAAAESGLDPAPTPPSIDSPRVDLDPAPPAVSTPTTVRADPSPPTRTPSHRSGPPRRVGRPYQGPAQTGPSSYRPSLSANSARPLETATSGSRAQSGTGVTPAPNPTESTIRVQVGDSLWSIAAGQLPSDATNAQIDARWRELYLKNRDMVGPNPNVIQPGQVLAVPPLKDAERNSNGA